MTEEEYKKIPVIPNDIRNEDGTVFSLKPMAPPTNKGETSTLLAGLIKKADTNGDDALSLAEAKRSIPITRTATRILNEAAVAHRTTMLFTMPTVTMDGPETNPTFEQPRNFVMDDQPLFNVPELLAVATDFQQARAIDTGAFGDLFKPITLPKGVEELRLSDFCPIAGEDSAFNCQNLPNGKIFVSVKAPGKT